MKRSWIALGLMTWAAAASVRAEESPPAATPAATSASTTPSTGGGLSITSSDGNFEVTLRGRLRVDGGAFRNEPLGTSQFKPYFSLEDQTSDQYVVMQERSFIASTLAPGFQSGAGYSGDVVGAFTYGMALYNLDRDNALHGRGYGGSGRVTFAPWHTEGRVLHVGASVAREHMDLSSDGKQPGVTLRVRTAGHLADGSRFLLLGINDNSPVDSTKGVLKLAGRPGALREPRHAGPAQHLVRAGQLAADGREPCL